jgi:hypothetical protein
MLQLQLACDEEQCMPAVRRLLVTAVAATLPKTARGCCAVSDSHSDCNDLHQRRLRCQAAGFVKSFQHYEQN